MKKCRFTRLVILLVAFVFAAAIVPANASAKTVKGTSFSSAPTVARFCKVKAVKTGTMTIKYGKSKGWYGSYVRFTAPKTKTYSFTMSNQKGKVKAKSSIVAIFFRKLNGSTIYDLSSKTNEGWRKSSWICNYKYYKTHRKRTMEYDGETYKYLHKRTSKLRLKKGETVFLDIYGQTKTSTLGGIEGSCTLTIK